MPEFNNEQLDPYKTIKIHFNTKDDYINFAKLLKQNLTKDTRSIWYPELKKETFIDKEYANE